MHPAHTDFTHCTLEREGVVDALCQALAKDLEMKPVPLNLYSNKEQSSGAGSRVLGRGPQQPVLLSRWAVVFSINCSF